jgi:hypothetical protein
MGTWFLLPDAFFKVTALMAFGMPETFLSSSVALQKCRKLRQLDTVVFGMPKIWRKLF